MAEPGRPLAGAPVGVPPRGAFVVGMPRSGTSLLVSLLDGHADVLRLPRETHVVSWHALPDPVAGLFGETRFGETFAAGTPERQRLEQDLRARLSGPTDVATALLALVASCAAQRPPAGRPALWLEKTPKHVHTLPVLLAAFGPATRAIVMLRDPRATFASHKARWGRSGAAAARRFACRWAEVDALAARFEAGRRDVLVLRYEDLVTRTEPSMRRVAEHLGIGFDAALLSPTRRGEGWVGNSSYAEKPSGVSTASLERWRETLTGVEVGALERALLPRLLARGYAAATEGRPGAIGRWRVETSVALNLWRRERDWRAGLAALPPAAAARLGGDGRPGEHPPRDATRL